MKLGFHTYGFYLHGIGQLWGGFTLPWPQQMNLWQLMDHCASLGLEGLHVDDAAFESLDPAYLNRVRQRAKELDFYLEYNFSMNADYDPTLNHTIKEGLDIAGHLGADLVKISVDVVRPRPYARSKFHPEVMAQLKDFVEKVKNALAYAEKKNIRVAVENHADAFSEEIIWVLDEINHPLVGACVDTANGYHVTEDPTQAVKNLAPRAFTNHFRDNRISYMPWGVKAQGAAVGDGDFDMVGAYELIKTCPHMDRINIELDMEGDLGSMERSLNIEKEALQRSVDFCRNVLKVA
ncbi:sugar phosphate isomerase/epimerase family protein [Desulforhopalus singaporensis]|uniref:Sugar phosphate isomerase/epimerase n=1 Tax=Desulforhopalus singaporensis TaxID=91360 RepID=A0A1H0SU18_9BACT|nr:TIM barrel protein [Desulforhopalus singaporensis]SDP45160.1 Sugar phosphate isomerase/epimerase [Desulforhopalus singaporensis]